MVRLRTWLKYALAALMAGAPAALDAAEMTATLSPESVPAGEGASLVLRVQGGTVENPQLPKVPGLIFNGPQTTGSSFNINGVSSQNLSILYAVGSMKAGEYVIPPITVRIDGQEFKTPAFTLKVTPSANQAPEGFKNNVGGGTASADGWLKVDFALTGDRQYVWVGEIAPVRIQAWLPEGRRIQTAGGLQPESSAFTLHNVSQRPQEGREVANGQSWHVVTWFAGLSAAKAGTWLPDIKWKTSQTVPDPNALRGAGGGLFGQTIQKEIPLSSKQGDGKPIEVRALPREGRPKNFGGAVGQFSLQGASLPAEWKTGEPKTVSAVISGKGNFNLLSQPDLRPDTHWKSYDGKPEFLAGDRAAFSGTRTWKFSVVAKKSGVQPLSLAFSYFDPETGRYETAESVAQNVSVTGADLPEEEPKAAGAAPDKPPDPAALMAGLHDSDGSGRSLTPPGFRPAFKVTLGICSGAALAGLFAGIWRTRHRDHSRAARQATEKATRAALHEAESFAARGDVTGFFTAARRALQTRLAAQWSRPAQAITLADVAARVPGDSPVTEIFREADRVEYGRDDSVDLNPWRSRLQSAMNSLTA